MATMWSWLLGNRTADGPIIETDKGKVQGGKVELSAATDGSNPASIVYRFKGIPFAAPPVGERRFKKPQPAESWEGVLDCTTFGKIAVQSLDVMFLVFMPRLLAGAIFQLLYLAGRNPIFNTDIERPHTLPSHCDEETTLNLNVETPNAETPGQLPVMVFLHGGGFQLGSGSQFIYHSKDACLARKGVVMVTPNYRLGVLGFLKVHGGDYNCGLWDQVAALEWVQANISKFGGDPNNVTIFGESAGAMSCAVHSVGPSVGRLFHRIILQSGCMQVGLTQEQAGWLTAEAAHVLGLEGGVSVESLKDVKADKLLTLQNTLLRVVRKSEMPLQPVIDGELLTDTIVNRWREGVAENLELMVGYTNEEELLFHKLFKGLYDCETETDLLRKVVRLLGPKGMGLPDHEALAVEAVSELKDLDSTHVPEGAGLWTSKALAINSLLRFAIPAHVTAHALRQGGVKSLYMFRFDIASPCLQGAAHAVDLPYVFGSYKQWGPMCNQDHSLNRAVSEAVINAWTNFAKRGNPNFSESGIEDGASNGQANGTSDGTMTDHSNGTPTVHKPVYSLPHWPESTGKGQGDADTLMIIDLPLAHSRVIHLDLDRTLPLLFKIVRESSRAMWFTHFCHVTSQSAASAKL